MAREEAADALRMVHGSLRTQGRWRYADLDSSLSERPARGVESNPRCSYRVSSPTSADHTERRHYGRSVQAAMDCAVRAPSAGIHLLEADHRPAVGAAVANLERSDVCARGRDPRV